MLAKALMGLGMSLALLVGSAAGQAEREAAVVEPATVYPGKDWARAPLPASAEAQVQALIDEAMSRELSDLMGESRQIVVIHKGQLVAEAYREGFTPETKLVSWSMAKSITQALVGRAVQEGLIDDIDAPTPSPWRGDDTRAAITWRQWMTMSDGLEYDEITSPDLLSNDAVQMLFGAGRSNVIEYIEKLPQVHEAGTHWNYSSAAFNVMSRAIFGLVGDGAMPAWLQETLFTPLGMDAQPEFDAAGTFIGGAYVYASARDFARFGYLYLRDGVWEGELLLPEGWDELATTCLLYTSPSPRDRG